MSSSELGSPELQDASADLLTERAIAFPLHVVENLVEGRRLRECLVDLRVIEDVFRQAVAEAWLEQQDPRNVATAIVVIHPRESGVVRALPHDLIQWAERVGVDPL